MFKKKLPLSTKGAGMKRKFIAAFAVDKGLRANPGSFCS
jgi:hypothetical protein